MNRHGIAGRSKEFGPVMLCCPAANPTPLPRTDVRSTSSLDCLPCSAALTLATWRVNGSVKARILLTAWCLCRFSFDGTVNLLLAPSERCMHTHDHRRCYRALRSLVSLSSRRDGWWLGLTVDPA